MNIFVKMEKKLPVLGVRVSVQGCNRTCPAREYSGGGTTIQHIEHENFKLETDLPYKCPLIFNGVSKYDHMLFV